ncbi:MAG: HisA/HisF-related TIM barrel protein [Gammaproteobacteria bacterium]
MEVIPVLDIRAGIAVHAAGGRRERYAPLRTRYADSSEPRAILEGLCARHGFDTVYVADLDALQGQGTNCRLLTALVYDFPQVEFWIDAGFSHPDALQPYAGLPCVPVLASESHADLRSYSALMAALAGREWVLSLDFDADALRGPRAILQRTELWPERLIAMQLDRVGTSRGPDRARLAMLHEQADGRRLYAAGGVRGSQDLDDLARLGLCGALVGTALYRGALLERLAPIAAPQKNAPDRPGH